MAAVAAAAATLAVGGVAAAQDEHARLSIVGWTEWSDYSQVRRAFQSPQDLPGLTVVPAVGWPEADGQSRKALHVWLWSPREASATTEAVLEVPAGLREERKLSLPVSRAQAQVQERRPGGAIRIFWGSAAGAAAGQQVILEAGSGLGANWMALNREMRGSAAGAGSPGGSLAVWPGTPEQGVLAADASLGGPYTLSGTLADAVTVDAAGTDFLSAVEIEGREALALTPGAPLEIRWKALPNAAAAYVRVEALKGDGETAYWSSSAKDPRLFTDRRFLPMTRVTSLVQDGLLLAPEKTAVTVPAGVLEDAAAVFVEVTVFGRSIGAESGGTSAVLQPRSSATIGLVSGHIGTSGDLEGPEVEEPDTLDQQTPIDPTERMSQ